MAEFRTGETLWFADDPCPECGAPVVTNGTKKVCSECSYVGGTSEDGR